jgi:hypothetical protein
MSKATSQLDRESVKVLLVRHVEPRIREEDSDDGFAGCCEMAFGDGPVLTGLIIGSIGSLGTALIIANDDRLYHVYSPEDAIDKPWEKLVGSGGAIIIDEEHNVTIQEIHNLQVASLGELF